MFAFISFNIFVMKLTMFSINSPCIMCVQYIWGCPVHRGDIMSTLGRYHEYIDRGMFSTLGEIMMNVRGYHEYIGGCSVHRIDIMIHVGEQLDKILSISIENPDVLNIPQCTHDNPQCTQGIPPMYSWYPTMY